MWFDVVYDKGKHSPSKERNTESHTKSKVSEDPLWSRVEVLDREGDL